MVKLDKTVVAESQQLVKHILDKDYDDWELEELPFIKNFVDTEWSNDLMTKVMWSQFVAEDPPEFIQKNIVGSFSEEFKELIDIIKMMDFSENEEDKESNISVLADAIADFFDIPKTVWDKENLKEKRRFMFCISYKNVVHRNKYDCIIHVMGFLLAAIRLTFTDRAGDFSFRKSYFPMNFRHEDPPPGPSKRSKIPLISMGSDMLQPGEIYEVLLETLDSEKVIRACSVVIFNAVLEDWKLTAKYLESEIDQDPEFPVNRERITKDSALILNGMKSLILSFLKETTVSEVSQARFSLVLLTLDSLKGVLYNFDNNIDLKCASLESSLKAMEERVSSQTGELDKTPLLPVSLSSSLESASPKSFKPDLDPIDVGKQGLALSLPFISAPKVESEFDIQTRGKAEKWDPNTRTLWHHLEDTMITCLELGISEYKQKLNFIYDIFDSEDDRRDFSNKVLKEFELSDSISADEFDSAIDKTCSLFDPTNLRSSEFYRTKLGEDALCKQRNDERHRAFMKRLSEWYRHAFPESHESHSQKLAMCRKFYDGIHDRQLAKKIAKSQKGYNAIHWDANPSALVKFVEETEQRMIRVKENELEVKIVNEVIEKNNKDI